MHDADYWRAEARIAAEDGHPMSALFAMACALFGELNAANPQLCREQLPVQWAQLATYAEALGVPLPD